MNIKYEAMPIEYEPATDQITLSNSVYSEIIADGNGAFAEIDANTMKMSVTNTTFTNVKSGSATNTPSFGGVFNVKSLSSLNLNLITATEFSAFQTTIANGGGRFIYLNQITPFTQTITDSVLTCSATPYTFSSV